MSLASRALAALIVAAGVATGIGPVEAHPSVDTRARAQLLRATARYNNPAVALADGYLATEECVAEPGLGGMGLHYFNPALLAGPLDPARPQVLLYEPLPGGRLRLVAVEWFAIDPDQDLTTDEGRPSLFGVPFEGPMAGHEPGMPVHFDLHAWVWKTNPAGMFTGYNPRVDCA